MNTKDLQYFHQLASLKNFSKVAATFQVSQPTVTVAIQRLEKQFAVPLIVRDRSHHAVELTSFGRQLDRHVVNILNELELAQKEAAHTQMKQVRFGLPPIIGNYYFPSLVPDLLQRHLLARLEIVERGSNETLKQLRSGELDMALLGSLSPLEYDQLAASTIVKMPFGILVAKDSDLAAKAESGVFFRDLKKRSFVALDEKFIHHQAFRRVANAAHVRPRIIYRTADVHVLGALVAKHIGIAFLTSLAAAIDPQTVLIPLLDDQQPLFYISKVRREQTILDGIKKELWQQLG